MPSPSLLDDLVEQQHGVVSHAQAVGAGLGRGWIGHQLRSARWRRVFPGVYVTHTGPVTFRSRVWAGLLHAGTPAVASHRTAAYLQGLVDDEPELVEVCVFAPHRTTRQDGLRIRRRRRFASIASAAGSIPVTTVEDTVLDLTELVGRPDAVVGWLTRACQRRLTTPARLGAAAARRSRLRHRQLVREVLDDVRAGVASALERRYVRDVERAHGLPPSERNSRQVVRGVNRYADVRYRRWRTRVELEGLAYHPADGSHRDHGRDNAATLHGDATLRYGWPAVAGASCSTALEVAAVLRRRGWTGRLRPCSSTCLVRAAQPA
ncbi:hypothetical protein [Angustibacter luteus]|uniref:AbiEi antitoxin C-terminal domain-containing protein n=1 Tax=Angustibacter luteus TaxID=658456 RepID=A0ABW1JJ70_9ACTN